MIAVDKHEPRGQGVQPTMREGKLSSRELERSEHGVVGDRAEDEDGPESRHSSDLGGKEPAAGRNFARLRLVLRRHAEHRIGNSRAAKPKAVIGASIILAFGKAEFAQSIIKQIARVVAGERAPCSVRPSQTGSQTDNQQLRLIIAKWRNRCVEPSRMGAALLLPECGEPRTERAILRRRDRAGDCQTAPTG